MNKTAISYLDYTWNPLAMRCTPVSPACTNCWHLRMANRLAKNPMLSTETRAAYAGETGPVLLQARLGEPLKRKKPAVIGVQFMGDLFHDDIPDGFIFDVWMSMLDAPHHVYQILTKRPERMLNVVTWLMELLCENGPWPNLWLGVTAENQQTADERIPLLLQTPAAVRFVSCEPLLGAVDLRQWLGDCACIDCQKRFYTDLDELLLPLNDNAKCPECEGEIVTLDYVEESLDWVIAGSETGPGARPMHLNWARRLRNQCKAAGVPFFHKSNGEWVQVGATYDDGAYCWPGEDLETINQYQHIWMNDEGLIGSEQPGSRGFSRIGNKRAGHLLDGRKWHEMPEEKR